MAEKQGLLSPKSDYIFKLLFGDMRNIDILTEFLKSVLKIPHDDYEKLTIVDPFLKREDVNDKMGILDVKLHTRSGRVLDVEIQVLEVPQMSERIIFYTSKMVTEQIRKSDNFDAIKPVISIIIMDFNLIKDSAHYHNSYRLYDNNTQSLFTDLIQVDTLELRKLPKKTDNTDLFDWLSFLKAEREEEYAVLASKSPVLNKAYGVLKELSQDERIRMIEEAREKQRRDEASRLRGAMQKGIEKGLKQGIEQGIEQGEKNAKINIIQNALVMNMNIDYIAKLVKLSVDEVRQIADEIPTRSTP